VAVGDALTAPDGSALTVTVVGRRVRARGLYHPHTLAGTLAVDGVVATDRTTVVGRGRSGGAACAPARGVRGVVDGAGGGSQPRARRRWATRGAGGGGGGGGGAGGGGRRLGMRMRGAPTLAALTPFVCSRNVLAADLKALAARCPALEVLSVHVSQLHPEEVRRGLPPASPFPHLHTSWRIESGEVFLTRPRDRAEDDGAAGVAALLEDRRLRDMGTVGWLMDPSDPPLVGSFLLPVPGLPTIFAAEVMMIPFLLSCQRIVRVLSFPQTQTSAL